MTIRPLTLHALIRHWGEVYAICYHQDRWGARRRDNGELLDAGTLAGLEAEIEADYAVSLTCRTLQAPASTDYPGPDDPGDLEDQDVPDGQVRFIVLRALRRIFPWWEITYSPQIRAWVARREGKTICEPSAELLVTALALIEEKWRNSQHGSHENYPWPVVSVHCPPLTGTNQPAAPASAPPGQDFRVAEIAALLRVSPSTIYRRIHRGDLEAVRTGRCFCIPGQALTAYLARQATARHRPGRAAPEGPAKQ